MEASVVPKSLFGEFRAAEEDEEDEEDEEEEEEEEEDDEEEEEERFAPLSTMFAVFMIFSISRIGHAAYSISNGACLLSGIAFAIIDPRKCPVDMSTWRTKCMAPPFKDTTSEVANLFFHVRRTSLGVKNQGRVSINESHAVDSTTSAWDCLAFCTICNMSSCMVFMPSTLVLLALVALVEVVALV